MALKPFTAMENPGADLVARFAREHFAKFQPDQELSPYVKETFTPILRYACAEFDRAGRYHPDHAPPDDGKFLQQAPASSSPIRGLFTRALAPTTSSLPIWIV